MAFLPLEVFVKTDLSVPNARNIHNHRILRRLSEKISFYSSYDSYASYASYAWHASENRRMFGIKAMGTNAFQRLGTPSTAHRAGHALR